MPPLPVLHLPVCFHTRAADAYSSCAFTGKCRRLPRMMVPFGWKTVVYANAGSDVPGAAETVEMLSDVEFEQFYPRQNTKAFHGGHAVIGERGWPTFNNRLIVELAKRVQPGDIILHPFGAAHSSLVTVFPQCVHIEPGIGYPDKPFGAWRIFESNIWRHYHWGRWDHDSSIVAGEKGQNRFYSFVVPNYFDLDDWPIADPAENEDYVLYMGRITGPKGMTTIAAIIREEAKRATAENRPPLKFVFAGSGDFEADLMRHVLIEPKPNDFQLDIEYRGEVFGRDRAKLVGRARCMLMPTSFIEPFGGSGVEAMLTGTPLIAVDYGAFVETIEENLTGFRCQTLGDWMTAITAAKFLNRERIAEIARSRFSLNACGFLYDAAFRQVADLSGPGWYNTESYRRIPVHEEVTLTP